MNADEKIKSLEYQVEVLTKIVKLFAEEIRAVTSYRGEYAVDIDDLLPMLD